MPVAEKELTINIDEIIKDPPSSMNIRGQIGKVIEARKELQSAEEALIEGMAKFQNNCLHFLKQLREFDLFYSPRVDGTSVGFNVLIGWKCSICKIFLPLDYSKPAWMLCRNCGGEMKLEKEEVPSNITFHFNKYKCSSCGHLYEIIK